MKKLILTLGLSIFVLFFALPTDAQYMQHHNQQRHGMMMSDSTSGTTGYGMMGNTGNTGRGMYGGMGNMMGGMHGMQGGMGMMQGMHGMYGGMMGANSQMRGEMMLVNALPQMREELSLTDAQVEKLTQLQNDFQKQQIDLRASLAKKNIDLNETLDQNGSVSAVRSGLQELSAIRVNMGVLTYETAQNMKNVLNDEQKEKLQNYSNTMMGMGMNY